MSVNYSVYFLLRKNVLFLVVDIMDIAAEGREKGSCGERRRGVGEATLCNNNSGHVP